MLLFQELNSIFYEVQERTSSHQKCLKLVRNLYNKHPKEEFTVSFLDFVTKTFRAKQVSEKYVLRLLDFFASFIINVTEEADKKNVQDESLDDLNTDPFLADAFNAALECHDLNTSDIRYRSCHFITLLLKYLGENCSLDSDICDKIQEAMLERILDAKPLIRCQAVIALARLQNPLDPECPVIKAFIQSLGDPNPSVRKQVVEMLAISIMAVPHIVERVRDIDPIVRTAAYNKCTIIGPKCMKIEHRQAVLNCGFKETQKQVKNCFIEKLLPRWLASYNGDYLQLLKAVKLDAYEKDFEMTEFLNTHLLEVYFKMNPINEIMDHLPINEDKVIPFTKLTTEVAIFWRVLTNYLRREMEEAVEMTIPDLPIFCDYIYSFHKEKNAVVKEVWDYYEFQTVLANLLLILKEYDFSDEAGRAKVHHLIETLLTCTKSSNRIIEELINIYAKLIPNMEKLISEVCHIISNIQEPLVEKGPTEEEVRAMTFKHAQLRVRVNVLTEDQHEAVENQDFEQAALIKSQIVSLRQQIEEIDKQLNETQNKVPVTHNDSEINYHILDILITLLKLEQLRERTTSLLSIKNELIIPFLKHSDPKVYVRAMECLSLCCMLNYDWAVEHLKSISLPFLLYRYIPTQDKKILLISIKVLSDLAVLFGAKLFKRDDVKEDRISDIASSTIIKKPFNKSRRLYVPDMEDENTSDSTFSNTTIRKQMSKTRRLYTIDDADELDSITDRYMTLNEMIDILLDFLDDEQEDIRYWAGKGLCNLLKMGIISSPSIVARLFLKWLSPVTEKHDVKLQQLLGISLLYYAQETEGSEEILEKAVIPVLSSIGNAPCTSPLADINVDNSLRFLAAITGIKKSKGIINAHLNLAQALCHKISSKTHDVAMPLYVKMLLYLEPPIEDPVVCQELIQQVDRLLEEISEKGPSRNLKKYKTSLTDVTQAHDNKRNSEMSVDPQQSPSRHENQNGEINSSIVDNMASRLSEMSVNNSVKRRKNRGRSNQLDKTSSDETATQKTIDCDDRVTKKAPSSDKEITSSTSNSNSKGTIFSDEESCLNNSTSNSSKEARVIVTETSDSENSIKVPTRRSKRVKKSSKRNF